jgi:formamidopyrimidine-DNA glycosylase
VSITLLAIEGLLFDRDYSDEIMYHARLHPEQYSDTFSDEQLSRLHKSILHVCKVAVDLLADSDQFPDDWLFKHRWGKGKKDPKLPNGAKITFLTVGGRTSAVVPSVQKKTGAVAGDVKTEDLKQEDEEKPAKGKGKNHIEPKTIEKPKGTPPSGKGQQKKKAMKEELEETEEDEVEDVKPKTKKRKADPQPKEAKKAKTNGVVDKEPENSSANGTGRRRSGRVAKGKA